VLAGVAWLTAPPVSSAARKFLATVSIVYGLASLRIVAFALSRPLVVGLRPFVATDAPEKLDAVVLLGATFAIQGRDREIGLATMAGTTRVLEAACVYRELGSPWVISSGGLGHGPDPVAESLPMRDALIQLGVPASRILLESVSLSTHDEAVEIARMLRSLHIDGFAPRDGDPCPPSRAIRSRRRSDRPGSPRRSMDWTTPKPPYTSISGSSTTCPWLAEVRTNRPLKSAPTPCRVLVKEKRGVVADTARTPLGRAAFRLSENPLGFDCNYEVLKSLCQGNSVFYNTLNIFI
jgi:hypothetical protein